jgi:hypothetical protein
MASQQAVSLLSTSSITKIQPVCDGKSAVTFNGGRYQHNLLLFDYHIQTQWRENLDIEKSNLNERSKLSSCPKLVKDALMMQGQMFTVMLGNLIQWTVESDDPDTILTPTLVALESLIARGWSPSDLSTESVKLLFDVVMHPSSSSTTANGAAALSVLKAFIFNNPNQHNILWSMLQEQLQCQCLLQQTTEGMSLNRLLTMIQTSVELQCDLFCARNGGSTCIRDSKQSEKDPFSVISQSQQLDVLHLLFGSKITRQLLNLGTSEEKIVVSQRSAAFVVTVLTSMCRVLSSLWELKASSCYCSISEYRSRQMQFLHHSLAHLTELDAVNGLVQKVRERKTRGGRNVWDGLVPLQVGDLIDCMDKEKIWFESIVVEVLAEGAVKIHFIGWGSKWDDVVNLNEIPVRVAILNSKTADWRAELFEGGLIEIKCNDDLVNQKWMWGRVRTLNTEESWVEVVYSFSNEPMVVKKAWLYGETICPVGMHTKDKSKSAAASILKPGKRVEQSLREKSQSSSLKETIFFDFDDDFDESTDTMLKSTSMGLESNSAIERIYAFHLARHFVDR